ncbi:hypothetical protein PGT21_017683 [Puccinia graminis f. sp. tritici]|uniref:Uncharacterized protein n=1 Tax=Puccinia graminis f. sp. tritici TaxID=56615 RepID=A0A5B0PUF7_PUCGR|nr:hypothetical protein PGT21_017683 [Puccinia graminis f. sp. tritici]KAA1103619.1 hypothetical protein PGTUg99_002539 [Puccinia graminis f. sp. tritici]KAA1136139.1 hypothetical protein PGTUg99_033163 [Puccinia graminis f. sp. tritici]
MENQALSNAIQSQTPGTQPKGNNNPNPSNTPTKKKQNSEEANNPPGNNQDNPYAVGGPREGLNPVTGLPKPKSKDSSQNGLTSSILFAKGGYLNLARMHPQFPPTFGYNGFLYQQPNPSRFNQNNQCIPGQATKPPSQRGRNGYRGNNFNTDYQDQRRKEA